MKEMIQNAVDAIRAVAGARPSVGLILGSGLGGLADVLEDASFVEYASIPGFPVSTAPGHAGRWHCGTLHGKKVCMMQGRFHSYEGYEQWPGTASCACRGVFIFMRDIPCPTSPRPSV